MGGPRTLLLAHAFQDSSDLRALAHPFLQRLMEASGETANLAVLDGDEAVYIDQVPSPRLVRMFEGVRCIAAPVRDHTGCVVAALSISGPTTRMTKERIPEMSRLVISISAELSAAMGHKPAGE